jgi:hypothetical protein
LDVPIGLSRSDRACDKTARAFLKREAGGSGSAVFRPPCREALAAKNYEEAKSTTALTAATNQECMEGVSTDSGASGCLTSVEGTFCRSSDRFVPVATATSSSGRTSAPALFPPTLI